MIINTRIKATLKSKNTTKFPHVYKSCTTDSNALHSGILSLSEPPGYSAASSPPNVSQLQAHNAAVTQDCIVCSSGASLL